MVDTSSADFFIPFQAAYSLLQDAANRDRTTARRTALVEILWHERFLSRESLMSRVGDRLGPACFGDSAWEDTFNRDMQAVKDAFALAGSELGYSRTKGQAGYYLRNEELLHPQLKQGIAHSIADVDVRQLSIYRDLGVIQRVRQALKASEQFRWETRYTRGLLAGITSMPLAQFIHSIIYELEKAGVIYTVAGLVAGWAWGEPRPAQQLDIILSLRNDQSEQLTAQLRAMGFILAKELPKDEATQPRRSICIDVIHPESDLKINLILPSSDDEFHFDAFRQSIKLDYGRETGSLYILSAEYLVLQNLLEYSIDREPAHLRSIAAVIFHRRNHLDRKLISKQAEIRGWQRVWEEIAAQADLRM